MATAPADELASPDVALFVEQASWLARRLGNSTPMGLLSWICSYLQKDVRRRWLQLFPLMHPDQAAAEAALCEVLSMELQRASHSARDVESVDRRVDWTETFARSTDPARQPLRYRSLRQVPVRDRRTTAALLGLAQSWCRLLHLAADVADGPTERGGLVLRRRALELALTGHDRRHLGFSNYDVAVATRLKRGSPPELRLAVALERVSRLWSVWFVPETDEDMTVLRTLAGSLRDADARNTDTLLEFTCAISLARAAVEAGVDDWPAGAPWRLVSADPAISSYPRLLLQSGELLCAISKGHPRRPTAVGRPTKVKDATSAWLDAVLPQREQSRSTGNQPDLVLSFWLVGREDDALFVLADAKRNFSGDGETYLRAAVDVAATYLLSYGHCMGLRVSQDGFAPTTALAPGVTIFCRQGTRYDEVKAVEVLRGADPLPTVFALDVGQHFGLGRAPWSAPALSAWMGNLGKQALGRVDPPHIGDLRGSGEHT